MRGLLFGAAILCAGSASASDCIIGDSEAIKVTNWSVVEKDSSTHTLTVTLESHLSKPVRMVNLTTGFLDVLGTVIGAYPFPPDFNISPGEPAEYTVDLGANLMPRLPKIAHEDVVPKVCTLSVVYADGTKEDFR